MASIDELKARVASARAAVDAAEKAGDAEGELAAVDALDAAEGAVLEAQKADRKLRGKRLERVAKTESQGRYQVAMFDLASGLSQLDPDQMPGAGVIVLRSATAEARKAHEAAHADGSGQDGFAANVNLICACTVAPSFKDSNGVGYRAWLENTGRGLVNVMVLEVGRLGGFQYAQFQRATK